MKGLFFLLFISFTGVSKAQFYFAPDTGRIYPYSFMERRIRVIDSTFGLEKDFDFRMQFVQFGSIRRDSYLHCFLTYKNKRWTFRAFRIAFQDTVAKLVEIMPQGNMTAKTLWKTLRKNNVLSIPDQLDLKTKEG